MSEFDRREYADIPESEDRKVLADGLSDALIGDQSGHMGEEFARRCADVIEEVSVDPEKVLDPESRKVLLATLQSRFEANMDRHPEIKWEDVIAKLEARRDAEQKLWEMDKFERAGHELDVAGVDGETGEYLFFTLSAQPPAGHRNITFDELGEALLKRDYPDVVCNGNACGIAQDLHAELMSDAQWLLDLQKFGKFDVFSRAEEAAAKGNTGITSAGVWLKSKALEAMESLGAVGRTEHYEDVDIPVFSHDLVERCTDKLGMRVVVRV